VEVMPPVLPQALLAPAAPPPSPTAVRTIASGQSRSLGKREFGNSIQQLLRCNSVTGVHMSFVPPAPVPAAARGETRVWAALNGLLARTMHHAVLGTALAAWLQHVKDQRQTRREALFDAMGGQLCSAIRRCGWMEKRSCKEVLLRALAAWRCEVDFRRLWRSRQHAAQHGMHGLTAIGQRRRHCVADATCYAAQAAFCAWHQAAFSPRETSSTGASASHSPHALPTLLRGPTTQFVQDPSEKVQKLGWMAPMRSISCPRFRYDGIGSRDKSCTQKVVAASNAAAALTADCTGNAAACHDTSCTLSAGLAVQPSAALISGNSLAAAALAVADLNVQQDEVAGSSGVDCCVASPVRNRRKSQPNSPASVGYSCGSSPSQFRLKWAEISVSEATCDPAAASPLPRGPERLFYDVSSYTGCAKYGGPPKSDRRSTLAARACTYRDVKDNAARLRKSFGGYSAAAMANAPMSAASARLHASP